MTRRKTKRKNSRRRKASSRRRRSRRLRALRGVVTVLAILVFVTVVPVALLRWIDPPTSAFMLQHRDLCSRVEYDWIDKPGISPNISLAVIVSEDQRFLRHSGFDFDSIADAVEERLFEGKTRGASTITQQTAKNLFLWPGKSFLRKGLEAWFTVWIEWLWPKQRILEVYLNVAQFGPCTFGVGAASWRFFGRAPADLGAAEGALLAAVLPNPVRLKAHRPSEYVLGRVDWILEQEDLLGGRRYLRGL